MDNKKEEQNKVETPKKEEPKKTAKKKKEKKVIVPFDKIDITTASDDDIIRSGIKHNTKADVSCYFIMFIIFVLAILPVALRIIIPRPITTEKAEIVYYDITCYKTTVRDNYELSSKLESHYRDGGVNDVTITFKWYRRTEDAKDGYVFDEVEEFQKMNKTGLKVKSENTNNVQVVMDFKNNPSLKDDPDLKNYVYHSTTEVSILSNELGYSCTTDSKTEVEVIDIETREKVE